MKEENKKHQKKKYDKPTVESSQYLEKGALGCGKVEIQGFIPPQCSGQLDAS